MLPRLERLVHTRIFNLVVDHREKNTQLAKLAMDSGMFDVSFESLRVGDYVVNNSVLIERKTIEDLTASIIDGRLFRQASLMVRCPFRPLFLIEGSALCSRETLHPHARLGAYASLAVMWRLALISTEGPEESLVLFRLLAEQTGGPKGRELRRSGYRPKRLCRRKLFVLQGLPGVGPKLAESLLSHFGSVEKALTADTSKLMMVKGCGPKKAEAIRLVLE